MTQLVIRWNDAAARAAVRSGGAAGLQTWADDLLAASQPLVPVSPNTGGGYLRDSGTASVDEGAQQAAVSYSGPSDKPNMPIWVHEIMNVNHETGQAKFLEMPLNASQFTGPHALADAIKAQLV